MMYLPEEIENIEENIVPQENIDVEENIENNDEFVSEPQNSDLLEALSETENSEDDITYNKENHKNDDKKINDISDKFSVERDLILEMRSLLLNYPLTIQFSDDKSFEAILKNIITIRELLIFCRNKSKKSEIRNGIISELEELDKLVDFKILYQKYMEYETEKMNYGKSDLFDEMVQMISNKTMEISEKIQIYLLVIPGRGKKQVSRYDNAHGLPANIAESFEEGEIEKGNKVHEGQKFEITEGEVQLLE